MGESVIFAGGFWRVFLGYGEEEGAKERGKRREVKEDEGIGVRGG